MLKKNDFIEIEYTGSTKEEEIIFDTTDEKTAKDSGIHNESVKYGPVTICIGQGQTILGLDKQLEGKEIEKDYTIDILPEDAFGKKDPKQIQLISTAKFKKANIRPVPGLQVNIDEQIGIIKTVSGGRTLVDFNHPLSGKEVVYKIKIIRKINDNVKKVATLLGTMLQVEEPIVTIEGTKAIVELAFDMPLDVTDVLKKKVLEVMPEIKEIEYKKKGEENKAATPTVDSKPAEPTQIKEESPTTQEEPRAQ